MKFRKIALILTLAASVPICGMSTLSALAQETNAPAAQPASSTEVQIDLAKDRLDKAKVRLDIAQKQVEAAKARLKAAEAEFKAAKANHEAKSLENQARKLSDASGLPEISEGQIEQGRNKSLASVFNLKKDKEAPVDLSKTRLKQVDFNAQPFDQSATQAGSEASPQKPVVPQQSQPVENAKPTSDAPPAPDKQAQMEPAASQGAPIPRPGLMTANQPLNYSEQPPIVP